MTPKQYKILKKAYDSLDVSLDSDDYTSIGKTIVIRRKLAELLGLSIKNNILPGAYKLSQEESSNFRWRSIQYKSC